MAQRSNLVRPGVSFKCRVVAVSFQPVHGCGHCSHWSRCDPSAVVLLPAAPRAPIAPTAHNHTCRCPNIYTLDSRPCGRAIALRLPVYIRCERCASSGGPEGVAGWLTPGRVPCQHVVRSWGRAPASEHYSAAARCCERVVIGYTHCRMALTRRVVCPQCEYEAGRWRRHHAGHLAVRH